MDSIRFLVVCLFCIFGFSLQASGSLSLTTTPEHFLLIDPFNTSEVNILCVLRDEAGQPVPLAGCSFKEYYTNFNMQFNEGLASPNYTSSDEETGKYSGRGLEHGECGLTFGGYKNDDDYILGCRVRPLTGVWHTAAMLLHVSNDATVQYHLEPRVTLALAGSNVTLQGKAEQKLDACLFLLYPADDRVFLDFYNGPTSDNHSLGHYHGAGLDHKECGLTLTNVQPDETSGFVLGFVVNLSRASFFVDFVELIVITAPKDVGMTNTTTSEDGVLRATCWSKNSRPVANITWLLDNEVIRQDSTNEGAVETEWFWDHDPQSITQHLQHNVTREDNGKQLVCRVEHMAFPSEVVDFIKEVTVVI